MGHGWSRVVTRECSEAVRRSPLRDLRRGPSPEVRVASCRLTAALELRRGSTKRERIALAEYDSLPAAPTDGTRFEVVGNSRNETRAAKGETAGGAAAF